MSTSKIIQFAIVALHLTLASNSIASSPDLDRVRCDEKFSNCGTNNRQLVSEIEKLEQQLKALEQQVVFGYLLEIPLDEDLKEMEIAKATDRLSQFFRVTYPQAKLQVTKRGLFVIAREVDLNGSDILEVLDRIEKEAKISVTYEAIRLDAPYPVKLQ